MDANTIQFHDVLTRADDGRQCKVVGQSFVGQKPVAETGYLAGTVLVVYLKDGKPKGRSFNVRAELLTK